MTYEQQQAVERAVEALRGIASDLEHEASPGEDRVAYEQRIAERLRFIADALAMATSATQQPSLFDLPPDDAGK